MRRVRSEVPQHITVHRRDEAVVIAAKDFRRLRRDVARLFERCRASSIAVRHVTERDSRLGAKLQLLAAPKDLNELDVA